MNPHEGTVLLAHAGKTVTLRFTWGAIGALQGEWGAQYADRIAQALNERKVDDLAELAARASGMTIEAVKEWSPPIIDTVTAISDAWAVAWVGADKAMSAKEGEGEENPRKAPSMWSRLRSALHSAPASAGPNSGHSPLTRRAAS